MWKFAYFDFCVIASNLLLSGIPEVSMQILQMRFSNDMLGIQLVTVESVDSACFNVSNIRVILKLSYMKI